MMREYHDADESGQWAEKGEEEKDRHGSNSRDMRRNGEFYESIESLGEILKPDQKSEQRTECTTDGESGSQGDSFGDKVKQHGHELSRLTTSPSHQEIQKEKSAAAGQKRYRRKGAWQAFHALRHKHKSDRRYQGAAAESDDRVTEFTLQP